MGIRNVFSNSLVLSFVVKLLGCEQGKNELCAFEIEEDVKLIYFLKLLINNI